MNAKNLLVGTLIAGAGLVAGRLLFSKPASDRPTPSSSPYETLDDYIEDQMRQFNIPGVALAIVEQDRLVHFCGFGRTRPGGEAPTLQTLFFIGSVTKSFTALAVMQLVEAGKLELDAPVQRYLPWFRVADAEASAQITLRHLLNHTSGLSMAQGQEILANLDDQPGANERQLRALSTIKLSHPVGSTFNYNNTNYNLLGLIVEVTSGESYADYIQKHIFNPLGMTRSYASKAEALKNGLAMGHRYWFGHPVPAHNLPIPLGSLPSGQLISCAEDMSRYLIAQLNGGRYGDGQILSSEGIDAMHRGTAKIIQMGFDLGSYAMGWESQATGNSTIVSHSGTVPDFGSFAALVPEQRKGLILLFNVNHGLAKITFDEFGVGAAERLAGETPSKTVFGWSPWLMRAIALIPLFLLIDVTGTLKRVNRWRLDPRSRPSRNRLWGNHILLPLLPNLLVTMTLLPLLSKMRGWIALFMPDFSWVARICGPFAAVWAFLRTGLVVRSQRKPRC